MGAVMIFGILACSALLMVRHGYIPSPLATSKRSSSARPTDEGLLGLIEDAKGSTTAKEATSVLASMIIRYAYKDEYETGTFEKIRKRWFDHFPTRPVSGGGKLLPGAMGLGNSMSLGSLHTLNLSYEVAKALIPETDTKLEDFWARLCQLVCSPDAEIRIRSFCDSAGIPSGNRTQLIAALIQLGQFCGDSTLREMEVKQD